MSIDSQHLKDYVIRPALGAIGLSSDAAINLILGTAAQESNLGTYLHQVHGPALGVYQCEPSTHELVWEKMILPYPSMRSKIKIYLGYEGKPNPERLIHDLALSTIICRLLYRSIPVPLPAADDIAGMASYWNQYYNRNPDKGTDQEFIQNYRKFVL